MSMDYIRRAYGVPAKRGAPVQFDNAGKIERGHIVGSRGHYLRIRWADKGRVYSHHPTWRLEYLEQPNTTDEPRRSAASDSI